MFADLLNSSYFALFLIVALGFMLGKIKIKGLSLDVSAVIFIALLFGHFGVVIPKELGNFGLVLFIFTIGIQAGPGFFDSFRSKGKTLIIITMLIICSASLTAVGLKYLFDIDTPSVVGLIAGALTSTPGLAVAIDSTNSPLASAIYSSIKVLDTQVTVDLLFVCNVMSVIRTPSFTDHIIAYESKIEKSYFNQKSSKIKGFHICTEL